MLVNNLRHPSQQGYRLTSSFRFLVQSYLSPGLDLNRGQKTRPLGFAFHSRKFLTVTNSDQGLNLQPNLILGVKSRSRSSEDSKTYSSDRFVNFSSSTVSQSKRMGDLHSQEVPDLTDTSNEERPGKITKSEAEWKAQLTPEQYSVCRNHGTERAWTGALLDNKKKGVYICACCGVELFSSSSKFESGSGWPSFYDVLKDKDVSKLPAVDIKQDTSHGMRRTEVMCGKCASHLGHVFNDGPRPTGLRYCINSVSLGFKSEEGNSGSGSNTNKNNL